METEQIAAGVTWVKNGLVNLYFVGQPGEPWVLVDAGFRGSFEKIGEAAEARFGAGAPPEAIYLTHGHFDHAGSALALATYWDVPVYAHRREMPFLSGKERYPPFDPTAGGATAFFSHFFPRKKINLGERLREMPRDLPGLPGWEVVETPGHAPGHVSFFRPEDRVLLAGDAFVTVDMESPVALAGDVLGIGKPALSRPPVHATVDWPAARRSLARLAELRPEIVACGHGDPMRGAGIAEQLATFADAFIAPLHGRYVPEPVRTDENGIVYLPPAPPDPLPKILAVAALAGIALAVAARRKKGT